MAKKWTEEEERYLEEYYGEVPNKLLAEKFGVSPKAISDKMRSLRKKRGSETEVEPKPQEKEPKEADVEAIPSGFYIKTEEGWKELSIKRTRG